MVKILKRPIALVIDQDGVIDLTSGTPCGRIFWRDIKNVSQTFFISQNFICLNLHDPHEFISLQPSAVRRKLLEFNLSSCGTPVTLSANALAISHESLLEVLTAAHHKHQ